MKLRAEREDQKEIQMNINNEFVLTEIFNTLDETLIT